MFKKFIFLFCFSTTISMSAVAQKQFKKIEKVVNSVNPDSIKRHIAFLADDKLQGRAAGSPGYQMAIDYVIDYYKQLGLQPAGENNTYLQKVFIRGAKVNAEQSQLTLSTVDKALTFGEDFVLSPHFEESVVSVNSILVFAGYGISAPEYGYDDYEGLDVKNKVVVIVSGTPDKFASTMKSHFRNLATISQTAFEKGAIGVIVKTSNNINLKNIGLSVSGNGIKTALNKEGKAFESSSRGAGGSGINLFGFISHKVFMQMVKVSEEEVTQALNSMKAGTPSRIELQSEVKATIVSTHETIESYNVVGVFPGSDPKLKNEYVVHSAHLDHIGITKPVKGDSINNGAHDKASGVSSTLEVARLYSKLKVKPKRSVLVVMVTGEELGLLGSSYFAEYPTVDKKSIVANVNMDMPMIIAPMLSVIPIGAENSSLMNQVKTAASYLKMDVDDDPEPNENRFVRSDQYSFVREGIPAYNAKVGNKTAVPGKDNGEFVKKWRADYYHQPQDQLEGGVFDFSAGKRFVQFSFLVSYQVAEATERPTWNEGNFFAKFSDK